MSSTNLPVACTLTPGQMKARRDGLLRQVGQSILETQERANGFASRFPPEQFEVLAQVIALERHCCAFLRFTLTLEPGGGPLWLEITGPAGSKEFLTDFWK